MSGNIAIASTIRNAGQMKKYFMGSLRKKPPEEILRCCENSIAHSTAGKAVSQGRRRCCLYDWREIAGTGRVIA